MRELYVKNGSQVIMTKKDICIISKGNDRQEVGDMKKITDVKRKSKGPRTEPWGTPKTTELYEEVWSWTMTHCCLHSRTLSPGVLGQGGDQTLLASEEEASTKTRKQREPRTNIEDENYKEVIHLGHARHKVATIARQNI